MSDVVPDDRESAKTHSLEMSLFGGRRPEGESYQGVLQRFHEMFKPKTYLEIGVNDGATLRLSKCHSIAIDPCFRTGQLPMGNQPICHLYQMTSDEFFKTHDALAVFGQSIEMAFLDGMHWFEFLLRDFINVERNCKHNSVIFMHDCWPADAHVGRRDSNDFRLKDRSDYPDWWAGDVWKALLIITKFRPDLRVVVFDAAPTGLVAITGLDPSSTLLSNRYFQLVGDYKEQVPSDRDCIGLRSLQIVRTKSCATFDALSNLFWL